MPPKQILLRKGFSAFPAVADQDSFSSEDLSAYS